MRTCLVSLAKVGCLSAITLSPSAITLFSAPSAARVLLAAVCCCLLLFAVVFVGLLFAVIGCCFVGWLLFVCFGKNWVGLIIKRKKIAVCFPQNSRATTTLPARRAPKAPDERKKKLRVKA